MAFNEDKLLQKIQSISQGFRENIVLPCEKSNDPHVLSPSVRKFVRSNTAPVKNHHIEDQPTIKGLVPFPSSLDNIYIIVKPEKAKIGQRVYFFYTKSQQMLLGDNPVELEVLPADSKFYTEGRFIHIITPYEHKKFSIKAKKEIIDILFSSQFNNTIEPFFLSFAASEKIPPINNMSVSFFQRTVFTDKFLISCAFLPSELLTEEIIFTWTSAACPTLDTVFPSLVKLTFLGMTKEQRYPNPHTFIFSIINAILQSDPIFTSFAKESDMKTIELIYPNLVLLPFSETIKFCLFILGHEWVSTLKRENPLDIIIYAINNCGVTAAARSVKSTLPKFEANNRELQDILRPLLQQPRLYEPAPISPDTCVAFGKLVGLILPMRNDFITATRKLESNKNKL